MGAWIETSIVGFHNIKNKVAPHVGAWIETSDTYGIIIGIYVAPHVGAWIETSWATMVLHALKSHPMWVRGLKP